MQQYLMGGVCAPVLSCGLGSLAGLHLPWCTAISPLTQRQGDRRSHMTAIYHISLARGWEHDAGTRTTFPINHCSVLGRWSWTFWNKTFNISKLIFFGTLFHKKFRGVGLKWQNIRISCGIAEVDCCSVAELALKGCDIHFASALCDRLRDSGGNWVSWVLIMALGAACGLQVGAVVTEGIWIWHIHSKRQCDWGLLLLY